MNKEKPNILLDLGQKKLLFDIVGDMQEFHKGKHFHEISFIFLQGALEVYHSDYYPDENDRFSVVVGGRKIQIAHHHIPRRFEQFLQLIRQSFLGVSFQSIIVENHVGEIYIYKI